jgi:hypothetical protein
MGKGSTLQGTSDPHLYRDHESYLFSFPSSASHYDNMLNYEKQREFKKDKVIREG